MVMKGVVIAIAVSVVLVFLVEGLSLRSESEPISIPALVVDQLKTDIAELVSNSIADVPRDRGIDEVKVYLSDIEARLDSIETILISLQLQVLASQPQVSTQSLPSTRVEPDSDDVPVSQNGASQNETFQNETQSKPKSRREWIDWLSSKVENYWCESSDHCDELHEFLVELARNRRLDPFGYEVTFVMFRIDLSCTTRYSKPKLRELRKEHEVIFDLVWQLYKHGNRTETIKRIIESKGMSASIARTAIRAIATQRHDEWECKLYDEGMKRIRSGWNWGQIEKWLDGICRDPRYFINGYNVHLGDSLSNLLQQKCKERFLKTRGR